MRERGLKILDINILSPDIIQRFFDAFRLGTGDDRKILQLFEGSVMILLQEIDLLV